MYPCTDRTAEPGQGNYVTAGEMASGSTEMCRHSEFYVVSNYVIKVNNLLYKSMLVGGKNEFLRNNEVYVITGVVITRVDLYHY